MKKSDEARGTRVKFEHDPNQPNRALIVTGKVMIHTDHSQLRHMPLDLDNGLPGILVRLGTTDTNEIGIHTHIDTCAAMSTGNLLVHQWFITTYPQCVAEYIQYDDSNPFEPIKLSCAIEDLTAAEALHGKLTAIVRYNTRYVDTKGQPITISFGLGEGITVNSIIGLPTLRHWKMNLCLSDNTMMAPTLRTRFDIVYENAGNRLPKDVQFNKNDFVRPSASVHVTGTTVVSSSESSMIIDVQDQ
jgi:hypothetical protein